jgi:hypothetical protein
VPLTWQLHEEPMMSAAAANGEGSRRAFPWTSRERFSCASTVGPDLGERRVAQRFPMFADTEEDGGSTPPAPTTPCLSRGFCTSLVPPMDEDRQRDVANGRESVSLLNQGVHSGPQLPAGAQTDVDLDLTVPGPPSVFPTRLL